MKVLAHIHTFNDEDVIDASLRALQEQTYSVEEILLVDNASTDRTLQRPFPANVTIVRHEQNLGTNGSVITGFKYAIAKDYDWIWILDADSAPRKNALEQLINLYRSWPPEFQKQIRTLSCLPRDARTNKPFHGVLLTSKGPQEIEPDPDATCYETESNMWTGSLFRVAAISDIGLPDPNFVLDFGDIQYGYKGGRRGYKAFICQSSVILHNLHTQDSLRYFRFANLRIKVFSSSPIRFYYLWRNTTYFWLYEFHDRNLRTTFCPHFLMFIAWLIKVAILVKEPIPILKACVRGFWDGIFRNMHHRY